MPGGFQLNADVCNGQSVGATFSGDYGTAVATSASANTKGSWVTLTSSSPVDCCLMEISLYSYTNSGTNAIAVDIGIGPSTPIVFAANLTGGGSGTPAASSLLVPCSIPAGSVISARAQSKLGGDTAYVSVKFYDGGFSQMDGTTGIDTIGFNSATTLGTAVTLGSGAKGAWSTITAATTQDYIGLAVGTDAGGSTAYGCGNIDIGIGASTPNIIIPDIPTLYNGGCYNPLSQMYPVNIPAGSVLSARGVVNGYYNSPFDITLYGFYK